MAFIVGAPRSGTNWVQRMLAAHPDAAATPSETMLFTNVVRPLFDAVHDGATTSPRVGAMFCDRNDLVAAARQLTDALYGSLRVGLGDPPMLIERSPFHSFEVELIRALYPTAPIVHVVRDGLEVAASLVHQSWGPESIGEAAALWRQAVTSSRQLEGDPWYREVRYEVAMREPWEQIRGLFDWMGLPVDGDVEAAVRGEATHLFNVTGSATGVDKWRSQLTVDELAAFDAVAGDVQRSLEADAPAVPHVEPGLAERVRRRTRAARAAAARIGASWLADAPTTIDGHVLVEEFLDAVHTGCSARLGELVASTAEIRLITNDTDERGRGAEGLERLVSVTSVLQSARQTRGDIHVGTSATTVVLDYDRPAGATSVVGIFDVPWRDARKIERIVWYQRSDHT